MSSENTQWLDENSGLTITVRPLADGRCSLEFHLYDLNVAIYSTRKSFLTASLGARSHFASPDGTCEFVRKGEKVRLKVQQWRGPAAVGEVDGHDFEVALSGMEESDSLSSREIRLF